MKYEIVFESERINFVKVSQKLVHDYLNMINNIEIQKFISHKRKTYSLEEELEWIKQN
jgi:predicted amino acid-binding ACT domain protein